MNCLFQLLMDQQNLIHLFLFFNFIIININCLKYYIFYINNFYCFPPNNYYMSYILLILMNMTNLL